MALQRDLFAVLFTVSMAFAQTQTPPDSQSQQAPPPSPPAWSVGPIDFSGTIDGYYSLNFNHPESRTNNLRNFDVRANSFSLNMAELTMKHDPDPVGFRIDLGFGRAFDIIHATEPLTRGQDIFDHIVQAYVSVKPKSWGGFQFDFGKFYTSAGAELTETYLNWNYSRSLLYANGPYYHFGVRTSKPLTSWFTAGFQVVNGWNNVEDNNSGKTLGFTTAMTGKKIAWTNAYYVGPEKTNTNEGYRHFWDTVLTLNPNDKANFYVNFDYGVDKVKGGTDNDFYGVAFAHRYAFNNWFAVSPRFEVYKDAQGFITGKAQTLKEFTMTAELKMKEGFLTRFEYRSDWSDKPFFDRGNEPASHKSMTTLLVGFVAYFGPK
jgi:hypothetical protein